MAKSVCAMDTRGQTVMEVATLFPLFMLFAFLSLQLGHLGIGIAIVNYAASSVARQAVAQNGFNQGEALAKFNKIIFAGLQSPTITGTPEQDGGEGTSNMKVTACAELPAFPLVGPFLFNSIHSGASSSAGSCAGADKWLGPVGLKKGSPYHFVIQGRAIARMNYNAKG
jgi:Flp pilus assembly protein TadG